MKPMSRGRLPFFVFVYLAVLLPAVSSAQDWGEPWSDPRDRPPHVDFSGSVGFLGTTDWSDLVLLGSISPVSGVLEQVLVRDLRVKAATAFDGSVTYWRGKYGFRTHVGFSKSSLVIGGTPLTMPGSDDRLSVDVDTWLYDVRGAIGFMEYDPHRWIWPYGFVGFGGVTYNLSRPISPPLLTFVEHSPSIPQNSGDRIVIVDDGGHQFVLAVNELGSETEFAFNFGIGTDFRIPMGRSGVGLRLEASDHVSSSPLSLDIHDLGSFGVAPSDTAVRFGLIHHFTLSAGLVVHIGH
jgi:hypothetical protein